MAAAIISVEESSFEGISKVKWTWTSATDGTASLVTAKSYFGVVLSLRTDPGATAPTANYDITVTDADGFDVMQGAGADRHTSTSEDTSPASTSVAFGSLTINISNAGDAKTGVAVLYIAGSRQPQ
jgi:hypothetical protein